MQTHDIAPHLTTLTRALGDKIGTEVSEQDLQEELQKYLDYGVPPDQAVRTILRHHGADPGAPARPQTQAPEGRVPLADLPGNVPNVEVLGKVLTLNPRTVTARGEEKEILWGLLGDETASVPYTSWRPLEGVEVGDVLQIEGAYTKEWRGETQLNLGDRTKVTKKPADAIPEEAAEVKALMIEELRPGLRAFTVTGRIIDVGPKEVTVREEPKTIYVGHLADATGRIEFTCWDDIGLQADQVVTLAGGSVRTFGGTAQLNFDKEATVTPFEGEFAPAEELAVATVSPLSKMVEAGQANDITVRATVLEVRPGSGLIWRDPETRRVVQRNDPGAEPDLRVKVVLDDGTGSVNTVVGRAFVENVLGKDLDACLKEAQDAMRTEIIHEQLEEAIVGRVYLAQGFARSDDYGLMFIARDMNEDHEPVEATAKAVLEELEAL